MASSHFSVIPQTLAACPPPSLPLPAQYMWSFLSPVHELLKMKTHQENPQRKRGGELRSPGKEETLFRNIHMTKRYPSLLIHPKRKPQVPLNRRRADEGRGHMGGDICVHQGPVLGEQSP